MIRLALELEIFCLTNSAIPSGSLCTRLSQLISLFNNDLRGFMQMVPEYLKPVSYDATRLEGLIGKPTLTSYETGIPATLDWLMTRR